MKFKDLVIIFETLEKISSRTAMTQELAALFKKTDVHTIRKVVYLVSGSLYPLYHATQFSIAQKIMIKIIAQTVDTTEENITNVMKECGDLGLVIEQFVWSKTEDYTILEVYEKLCLLEKISGKGSQELKQNALAALLKKVDPLEAKYIVRIVLGTLRLGFSDMTIIDALSWMCVGNKSLKDVLEHAYNMCADTGLLAEILVTEGIEGIKKIKIHLGVPIRPAAAERLASPAAIIEKIGPCVAQPKLDGFRLQAHIDKSAGVVKIRFFSRNLLDMSAMFPELIKVCENVPVTQAIIDGEAIVYDPDTHRYMNFQETVKRRRKHDIQELVSEYPLQFNMFDIMYLDGRSLLHEPQSKRFALLQAIYKNYKTLKTSKKESTKSNGQMSLFVSELLPDAIETLQIIQEVHVSTPKALEDYFMQEISEGLEGIVVKKPDSFYQAGKRNFNWIKLKYHATKKLEDTIDVVILGYYAGRGKRAEFGIGAFLVGIYNDTNDQFETVAKVGTGLTDKKWIELKALCDTHKLLQKPKNVLCAEQLEPMIWIDPVIVCEVLADEVTVSPLHTAGQTKEHLGLALRFPRFIQFRFDKSFDQTTSVNELKSFQKK